jgi:hypothetical protein
LAASAQGTAPSIPESPGNTSSDQVGGLRHTLPKIGIVAEEDPHSTPLRLFDPIELAERTSAQVLQKLRGRQVAKAKRGGPCDPPLFLTFMNANQ